MSYCSQINELVKLKGLNRNVINPLKWHFKIHLLDPHKTQSFSI